MVMFRMLLVIAGLIVAGVQARGAQPPPPASSLPDESLKNLAGAFRALLVQSLPSTLYESNHNWGHTTMVRKLGKGLRVQRVPRNDGTWRKFRLSTRNPAGSLVVALKDWKCPSADRMTFTTYLAFDAGIDFQQQLWESGLRLYSGSTRARLRIHLTLKCEVLMRSENNGGLLPDLVFRLRVLTSDLRYDHLVVEHTAGIGGTGAKILGEALHNAIRQFRPSLERDLLAKANAAIVKAADTREIRIGLNSLWKIK